MMRVELPMLVRADPRRDMVEDGDQHGGASVGFLVLGRGGRRVAVERGPREGGRQRDGVREGHEQHRDG